jgi:predicted O-linked N-acetylglucosamine transferase (SPINDLY family)
MSNAAFLAAIEKTTAKALPLEQLINQAQELTSSGQPELARQLYQVWISFNKDHPLLFIAHFNCSTLMSALGDEAAASVELRAALAISPDFAPACINLGTSLERQGGAREAVEVWRQGLERMGPITGDSINYKITLLKQMSRVLADAQQLEAAENTLTQCLDLNMDQRDVCEQYSAARLAQCKWPIAPVGAKITTKHILQRLHPLSVCAFSDDPLLQLASGHRYIGQAAPIETRLTPHDRRDATIDPKRKLRIGYVSSDLRHHAVGYLMVNLFEEHDTEQFDIYAYYCGIPASDPIQARIKAKVTQWRDIRNLSDDQAAEMIAADGIDILIDVNGHTRDARIGVFARHPAPIQVNWLGYPGTMGSPFHHYLIGDAFVTPEGFEHYYSEKILRLPCYQPNDRNRLIADQRPTRESAGLPDDKFVFCCFNASHKITRFVFARWMEILSAAPDSVLWLLDYSAETNQRLRDRAQAAGVDPSRLIFAPKLQNAHHLARYPLADLVIDTAPYGAHTTASDAMWMGVPVLTWAGRCFSSRVCGSLVRAAGLPELVCDTADAFVARAIALSTGERLTLASLRQRLADNRDTCTLFDIAKLTRSIEGLYVRMRAEHAAGALLRPNLANLEAYFEVGLGIDHEAREIGQLADYDGFWRERLAKRDLAEPLQDDGRMWTGQAGAPARIAAKAA